MEKSSVTCDNLSETKTLVPIGSEKIPLVWPSGAEEEKMNLDTTNDQALCKQLQEEYYAEHLTHVIRISEEDHKHMEYVEEEDHIKK